MQGATQLRIHAALLVSGLLQTPAYADATFRRGTEPLADDEIARRVELRMARQAVLDRDPDPLRLAVVLDEAVLRRRVGDPAVMREQLTRLAEAAQLPNVTLQVVPFEHGYHPALTSEFQIFGFPWPTDPGVAYVEHRAGALYLEQPYEIEAHVVAFEHASVRALPPDDSIALIRTVAKELP